MYGSDVRDVATSYEDETTSEVNEKLSRDERVILENLYIPAHFLTELKD